MTAEHPGEVAVPVPTPRRFTAAVLSVGSELLLGDLTDTNATWLSQRLRELGVEVVHHLAVRDDLDEMVTALRWLAQRVDGIVVGGGLGPTPDDVTREAVAAAAGIALEAQPDLERAIEHVFASRGLHMTPDNLRQARVPAGADVYQPVGTAPAFGVTLPPRRRGDPCRVWALPGVPWEMHALFERDVRPELLELAGAGATVTRVIHVTGSGESTVAHTVAPVLERVAATGAAAIAFLAKGHEIQVRVTVTGPDPDAARRASQPLVEELTAALGAGVAGIDDEELEHAVVRLLTTTGTSVATAESATAGLVAARLGSVPASTVLRGGAVVYASDLKTSLLGIDADLVETHGAVSEQVTRALALRAREVFSADWGIGVTGAAGPSGQDGATPDTVFWSLASPDGEVEVHGRQFPGDRNLVRSRLAASALDLLRRRLTERG